MTYLKPIFVLSLALCASQAAFATTAANQNVLTRKISLSGLDLSRPADAAQLYHRIQSAASYVCQPLNGDDLARTMHYRTCVKGTVARAVADTRAPLLTHYVVYADTRSLAQE
jgi:UrcA family protein